VRGISITFIMLLLCACSSNLSKTYNISDFNKSYKSYDLNVFWNEKREGEGVTIEGVVKNVYIGDIKKLEITARIKHREKKLSEKTFSFFPDVLRPDHILPFKFSMLIPEIKDYDIDYFYRGYLVTDEIELIFGSFK